MFRIKRQIAKLGVLGINRRNAAYTLRYNPRRLYPLVDDKLQTRLDGTPYLTPCTALVTPGVHHTRFKLGGHPDLEVGYVDYTARREIEATWPASP